MLCLYEAGTRCMADGQNDRLLYVQCWFRTVVMYAIQAHGCSIGMVRFGNGLRGKLGAATCAALDARLQIIAVIPDTWVWFGVLDTSAWEWWRRK